MPMRYARRLSTQFLEQLEHGSLNFLIAGFSEWQDDDPFAFDVQIREGDRLTFYHGTTALLTIRYIAGNHSLEFSAARAYAMASGYAELMGQRPIAKVGDLETLVPAFLRSATEVAADNYYRNRGEGYWQNRLGIACGRRWQPDMDWLIIDREAVVGFGNDKERRSVLDPIQAKFQEVKNCLQNEDAGIWGVPDTKGFGNECDFLALGLGGELFCIELKHGSNASGVYWGCLQVAVYREVFAAALEQITDDIKTLVIQKVALGLLPPAALLRLPKGRFSGVVPVLAIAEPNDRSSCWNRLRQVVERCPKAKAVVAELQNLDIVIPMTRDL